MSTQARERPPGIADDDLLELVQRQTFGYFRDMAHPSSGLVKDRSSGPPDLVTIGGSGFAVMAMIVATERGWVTREEALARIAQMVAFLRQAVAYHGVFPHFMNGRTGATIPFSRHDDGADLIETSFLIQGLLCARLYFSTETPKEAALREGIDTLWLAVEWDWHTRGENCLTWHWSPNGGWNMDHRVRGWDECLIAYVLAASSPSHPVGPEVYHEGWATGRTFLNGQSYYGIDLPLGPAFGGPLFFAHYSFLGLDPRGLRDRYADYWHQNTHHVRINHAHCLHNPNHCRGYGAACWGLTASDKPGGYAAHAPANDHCVIAPTAALASFPYCPELSMPALRHFYHDMGAHIWREHGFTDAFSEEAGWYSSDHLAIDQGPIVVMIENYRSGLMWRLFMSCPEIQAGVRRLGFESPQLS